MSPWSKTAFLTFDREREQYLCAAVLRPGNVPATCGTVGVLCRLLPLLLRQAFPQARFLVRLDGGFATPEVFDFLDAEPRLDYVVAMAKNAVLQRQAEPALLVAQAQSPATGETAHVYTDTQYQAGTWGHARRVVIKAEVVRHGDCAPRDNPRFVYERIYCARGGAVPGPLLTQPSAPTTRFSPPAPDRSDIRCAMCATITPSAVPTRGLHE